jgi:hypothetical protein
MSTNNHALKYKIALREGNAIIAHCVCVRVDIYIYLSIYLSIYIYIYIYIIGDVMKKPLVCLS